jgi:type I restriction enzyme R subunit
VADLPSIVKNDETYQNAMKSSDAQNARVESDRATWQAILTTMSSGVELFKAVNDNQSLRKWIMDMVFNSTYEPNVQDFKDDNNAV